MLVERVDIRRWTAYIGNQRNEASFRVACGYFIFVLEKTQNTRKVIMAPAELYDAAKDRILEHARTRFFEEGIARVSVDEITSELGMSKKTFYKHFERKEDLVHEIVSRMLADVGSKVQGIVAMAAPLPVKIDALVRVLGIVFKTVSKQMLRDLQVHVPEAWSRIHAFRRDSIMAVWATLVDEGKRTGYIRPEINERVFVLSLYAAVESIVNPAVLANEPYSCDEALESIIAIFLTGILTPDAARTFQNLQHTP
jgi:AcrR family transcriptional regulator